MLATLEVGSPPFSLLPAPFSRLPAPGSLAPAPSSQLPAHVSMPLPWQKVKTTAKTAARTAAATANASAEQRQQRVAIFTLEVGSPPTARLPAPAPGSSLLTPPSSSCVAERARLCDEGGDDSNGDGGNARGRAVAHARHP